MVYLKIENLSKTYGEKILFKEINFSIEQGQKVALVGLNGSGKSTLMKIIMNQDIADSGKVTWEKQVKVSFVAQDPIFSGEESIYENIFLNTEDENLKAIKAYNSALENLEDEQGLHDSLDKMNELNAWDYETKIKEILGSMGLFDLEIKLNQLSGGQRKRVAIAKSLIENPDFLILDEPTNHLDIQTIEFLESYLSTSKLSILMVTHDRYFLEKVTNEIIELEYGNLYRYQGNYGYFLEKKDQRKQIESSEIDKAKNLYKRELEWIRRQPKARGTKAKYRVDSFEITKEKAFSGKKNVEIELNITTQRLGNKILEIDNISKGFGDKIILKDFSYKFQKKDRIGIIGENGMGKTTFLNMLTEKISPDSGKIEKGDTTMFGYYKQEEDSFNNEQKLIDCVKNIAEMVTTSDGNSITASQFLNKFGFAPKVQNTQIGKLSGGEKRRLQLLLILIKNPNFLILDEPTNDLDLMTLNVLEEFLDEFSGCLILVSHDRYFMDRLVEHIFVFQGEGIIKDFPGNYTDYREELIEEKKNESKTEIIPTKIKEEKKEIDVPKIKLSFKEQKQLEAIPLEIEKLEKRKEEINQLFLTNLSREELEKFGEEMQKIVSKIEENEMIWLELSER